MIEIGISRGPGRWAKYGLFAIVAAMVAFVAWNNERPLLDPASPAWARLVPIRWHLVPHGLAGLIALSLGALQFSTRLRRRWPRLHRLTGRVYVGCVFVAGPVAIWMAFVNSPWFMVAFTIVQAGTWMLLTGIAFACIRRRAFAAHREWMIRSYAIVLNFLEGRVLMAIPAVGAGGMDSVVLVNWACLALTLVATECLLRWREIIPPSAARAPLP